MIVVLVFAMLAGFGGLVVASERAVGSARALAATSQIPPFFIGVTLLAIGTDLPEIANSIAASVTGHGDINVGDSIGSAATQITLVLGLLPILAGTLTVPKTGVRSVGMFTAAALAMIAVLLTDGHIGRSDALILLAVFIVGSWVIYTRTSRDHQLTMTEPMTSRGRLIGRTIVAMLVLAVSALVSVWAIVGLAERLDVPEFLISFFVASIGTSLPELFFDLTALRRGATAMAVGDVMGSSFVDSTLSIGIGPLLAPTAVTAASVVPAALTAMIAVVVVTVIMSRIDRHDWRTGALFLVIYAGFFIVLL